MSNERGVWTYEDCTLVLIDYQEEIFHSIRSESKADLEHSYHEFMRVQP
jgi:hypothetical protein